MLLTSLGPGDTVKHTMMQFSTICNSYLELFRNTQGLAGSELHFAAAIIQTNKNIHTWDVIVSLGYSWGKHK